MFWRQDNIGDALYAIAALFTYVQILKASLLERNTFKALANYKPRWLPAVAHLRDGLFNELFSLFPAPPASSGTTTSSTNKISGVAKCTFWLGEGGRNSGSQLTCAVAGYGSGDGIY